MISQLHMLCSNIYTHTFLYIKKKNNRNRMKDETRSECQILLYYSNILFKKALHKLLLSSNRELCANIVYSVMPKRPLLSHLCYTKKKIQWSISNFTTTHSTVDGYAVKKKKRKKKKISKLIQKCSMYSTILLPSVRGEMPDECISRNSSFLLLMSLQRTNRRLRVHRHQSKRLSSTDPRALH